MVCVVKSVEKFHCRCGDMTKLLPHVTTDSYLDAIRVTPELQYQCTPSAY